MKVKAILITLALAIVVVPRVERGAVARFDMLDFCRAREEASLHRLVEMGEISESEAAAAIEAGRRNNREFREFIEKAALPSVWY